MEEEIFAVAKCICGAAEGEEAYLAALCRAEAAQLEQRLKEPLAQERRGAFLCAAAWLAAADYFSGKGASGASSWRAGDVTVQEPAAAACGTAAENLRHAADVLMRGLLVDDGFAFLGVQG